MGHPLTGATTVVPKESTLRPLIFNILINIPEKPMECTFIKLLDATKLGGQVNRVESRAAIQWDLNMLKEWTHTNLMILYKVKSYIWEGRSSCIDRGWGQAA